MAELQTIHARCGVATFVPTGHIIKIINNSGSQVIDTWAFALPTPEPKRSSRAQEQTGGDREKKKKDSAPSSALPSQQDAEKSIQKAFAQGAADDGAQKKSSWSSYVPSLGLTGGKKQDAEGTEQEEEGSETEQQTNSRTWASYFSAGKGFSSYIPKQATSTVSRFASQHERDRSKTYLEQLSDFSKTPVGAGLGAAMTGSGYSGSLYASYQAWNARNAADRAAMDTMSMPHSRAATLHLCPRVRDTLVTNLREPILTLVEDSSPGLHDTLMAACDPMRYKGLGVPQWEEHGSCAENLVLALKELNERAGLQGEKAVGARITVNDVPAPLNLFMNIPWDDRGDLGFKAPKSRPGDYVRFKAERDVVVVMSACPQDVLDINNKQPTDASFVVEEDDTASAVRRTAATAKGLLPPRKKPLTKSPASATATADGGPPAPARKKPVPPNVPPPQKKKRVLAVSQTAGPTSAAAPTNKPPRPIQKPVQTAQPAKEPAQTFIQTLARPKKKPVPPAVTSETTTMMEKKKPRKLVRPLGTAGSKN